MADRLSSLHGPGLIVAEALAPGVEPDPLKGGDVHQWSVDQAALIRARRFGEIDWVNVADEIESVGKSEFRSLASNLEIVLIHILKWEHQPERRSRSWIYSINEHRHCVEEDLLENPSLKARAAEGVERAYPRALYTARMETGLSDTTFPAVCPNARDAIMTRPFVLDPTDEGP